MYLTAEEERILNGEKGWAYEVSMKILARLGDLFQADRLIPIKSAHISGVSYKTMGDAPIDFLEALTKADGKVKVSSTVNPSGFDPDYLAKRFPKEYQRKQKRIIDLYKQMGVDAVLTCTPYYLQQLKPDWHLAWAESSAVVYANSVLKSWTNREGAPSALAAALIGKTPNCGVHKTENRKPSIVVKVEENPKSEAEFGALGIYVGKMLKNEVPVFEGLADYTDDDLKQLGAGLASSGMTSMFYHQKPIARSKMETISIERNDMKNAVASLSTAEKSPDLIFIGCPHCSLKEIETVAQALENKKVKNETELWVCTSRYVKNTAKDHVDIIEKAGGHVLCDTCAVVTWVKNLGFNTLMTNSAKTAYYAPTLNGVDAILAPLKTCIETACD